MIPLGRRLLQWLSVILIVHALAFLMIRGTRGGPFDADRELPPQVEQALLAEFKLDQPLLVQYWDSLLGLLKFNFGPSMRYRGREVGDILASSFPTSITLGVGALLLALMIGIPMGLLSAKHHLRAPDRVLSGLASLLLSIPNFVVAGALIALFSFKLKLLPPAGYGSFSHLILPMVALGLPFAAALARLSRNAALEALESDAIRAAQARGITSSAIIRRHVLKQSLLPVVAYLGPAAAGVLTGSLVIEQVFALPGLGTHFVQAALNRDYTLALGTTVSYTAILGAFVLIGDILLAYLNPQVKSIS